MGEFSFEISEIVEAAKPNPPLIAQRVWAAIIREAVLAAGGTINQTFANPKLNAPDGGVDIDAQAVMKAGSKRGRKKKETRAQASVDLIEVDEPGAGDGGGFLFTGGAVYSVKSGEDGLKPKTLRDELTKKGHEKLRQKLQAGQHYVHCLFCMVSQVKLTKLKNAATSLATKIGIPADHIHIFTQNELEDGLRQFPAVAAEHLPGLFREYSRTVNAWGQQSPSYDPNVPFVELEARKEARQRIVTHLLTPTQSPVLHVCGLSGIGKTRLVHEAVRNHDELRGVMYLPNISKALPLIDHLVRLKRGCVRLVVDECGEGHVRTLREKLDGHGHRIRVVSIGPQMRGEHVQEPCIQLPEPKNESEVLSVLRAAAGKNIPEPELKHLAFHARHDIRLGLLFLNDRKKFGASPLGGSTVLPLLRRVIEQFKPDEQGAPEFKNLYPYLSTLLTVGVSGDHREELEWVASEFDIPRTRLDEIVAVSRRCGLAERGIHICESTPRGLATRLFEEVVWPVVQNRLPAFFDRFPSPVAREQFLHRVELCSEEVREHVAGELSQWCYRRWGTDELLPLKDEEEANLLNGWLRLSPERALQWLRRTVRDAVKAGGEKVRSVQHSVNHSGRIRRVWSTIRILASFREHFVLAEELLFQAAQLEDTPGGSGLDYTWTSLFSTLYSHCELPHSDRVECLLRRLRQSDSNPPDFLRMGVLAMVRQVAPHELGTERVGGRLVPRQNTYKPNEEYWQRVNAIKKFVELIEQSRSEIADAWLDWLAREIESFALMDTFDELDSLYSAQRLTPARRRALRYCLLQCAYTHRLQAKKEDSGYLKRLEEWARKLEPSTLREWLEEVLRVSDHRLAEIYLDIRTKIEDRIKVFQRYAPQVIEQPAILDELRPLLESEECKSGGVFGRALGLADTDNRLESVMKAHMRDRAAHGVLFGYLTERKRRDGEIPGWALTELEAAAADAPGWSARLTVCLDESLRGFERLFRCVEHNRSEAIGYLGGLRYVSWSDVLTPERQARVLNLLVPSDGDVKDRHVVAAMELVGLWMHQRKNQELPVPLLEPVLRLLEDPESLSGSEHGIEWVDLARLAAASQPVRVIGCIATRAFSEPYPQFYFYERAVPVLIGLAPDHSETIMRVFRPLLSKTIMYIALETRSWATLFELFPVALIQEALRSDNQVLRMNMARLIPPPRIDAKGNPVVPPITRWFFETYGDDGNMMSEFSLGSMRSTWMGPDASNDEREVQQLQKAFADDASPHVRKWAQWRMDSLKNARVRYNEHREERERS